MFSNPSVLSSHLHSSLPLSPSRLTPSSLLLSYPFLVTLSTTPLTLSFYDLALSAQHHYLIRETFSNDPLLDAEILSSSGDYVMVLFRCVKGSKCIRVSRHKPEEELVLSTGLERMYAATSSFEIEGSLLMFSPSGQLYEIMIDDLFCSSENFLTIGEDQSLSKLTTKSFPLPENDLSILVTINSKPKEAEKEESEKKESPEFLRFIKDDVFFDKKLLSKPLEIFLYPYPVYENDLCIVTQENGIVKLFSVDLIQQQFLLVQCFNSFGEKLLFSGFDTCHEFFIVHSIDQEDKGMIEFYNVNRLILGEKRDSLSKTKTVDFFDHVLPFEMGKEAKEQRFFGLVTTLDSVDQCFFHVYDKKRAKIDLYALSIPFIHQKQSKISEAFAQNLSSVKLVAASLDWEALLKNFGSLIESPEPQMEIIDQKLLDGISIEKKLEKVYKETLENIVFLKMKRHILNKMAPELEEELKRAFETMVKKFLERMSTVMEVIKSSSEQLKVISDKISQSLFALVNICQYMTQITKANLGLLEWMATKEGSHRAEEIKRMLETNTKLIEMLVIQMNRV